MALINADPFSKKISNLFEKFEFNTDKMNEEYKTYIDNLIKGTADFIKETNKVYVNGEIYKWPAPIGAEKKRWIPSPQRKKKSPRAYKFGGDELFTKQPCGTVSLDHVVEEAKVLALVSLKPNWYLDLCVEIPGAEVWFMVLIVRMNDNLTILFNGKEVLFVDDQGDELASEEWIENPQNPPFVMKFNKEDDKFTFFDKAILSESVRVFMENKENEDN